MPLDLALDLPIVPRHLLTLTAPPQDLAKALSRRRERPVLLKFRKEILGQSLLHQATPDLSHQSVIEMIHMQEARDLRKREILIQLIKDSSLVMCGVVLVST